MIIWKRNLFVIFLAQFCSILGFGLGLPFAPFYIQTLGDYSESEVKFYSGLFFAGAALPLAIMGPIWGMLADRYGRKLMLLRACFIGGGVLACMGLVQSVELLIFLRVLQGAFTGTVTAAVTLVVTGTPEEHHGYALGWVSAAVMGGMTMASFVGGLLADAYGYRFPFFISGGLIFLSGVIVSIFVQESFTRPDKVTRSIAERVRSAKEALGLAAPILLILMAIGFVRMFDKAMFPLLVQEMRGGLLQGSASMTGIAEGIAAIAATLSGVLFGRLSDRYSPMKIGRLTSAGAALFMLLLAMAGSMAWIFPARFGMYFFMGGMDPMFQAWLAKNTPESRRGTVMGLAVTARATGWIFAPIASAWIATTWSLHTVFYAGPFLFLAMIPLITILGNRVRSGNEAASPEAREQPQAS